VYLYDHPGRGRLTPYSRLFDFMAESKMRLREDWRDHDAGLTLTARDRWLARECGLFPQENDPPEVVFHPRGIPMLNHVVDGIVCDGEPILSFDRRLDQTPRQRLLNKLCERRWAAHRIISFLDRLGFK